MNEMKKKKKREIVEKYDSPVRLKGGRHAIFPKKWNFNERCNWIRQHAKLTLNKKHLNLNLSKMEDNHD